MRWYAVLFWIWVAASLSIFLWRRLNRSGRGDEPTTPVEPSSPLTKQWAPPPRDPDAPPVPTSTASVPAGTASESASARPTPDEDIAPTAAAAPQRPAVGGTPPTLVELLEGITLPHGLVPLTQAMPSAGPITTLVAATDTASAEQVGTALADELERLGYEVATTGTQTAVADGPRGTIDIEVHPHAGSVTDGGSLRFPTAAPGSVVVELRVSGSPR